MKVKKNLTNKALVNKNKNRVMNKGILNKKEVNTMKKKNMIYSAKNTNKNHKKANSVLKPDTSSLSPSMRSKGTLEASQRKVIYRIKQTGRRNRFKYNIIL